MPSTEAVDGRVRACLHQPNFLPWTKLFDKVLASDVYIAYDSVQYTRTEYHSRQRIKGRGGPVWLSVPVRTNGRRYQRLCDTELANEHDWRGAHLRLLAEHYRRATFFDEVITLVEQVYRAGHAGLVDLNLALIGALTGYVGTGPRIVRASTIEHEGDNTDRLIQLTRAVGAGTHLTSTYGTSRQYIDWDRVADAGIAVESQQFTEPVRDQLHGEFVGQLSVIDLLFCAGPGAVDLLGRSRRIDRVLVDA